MTAGTLVSLLLTPQCLEQCGNLVSAQEVDVEYEPIDQRMNPRTDERTESIFRVKFPHLEPSSFLWIIFLPLFALY